MKKIIFPILFFILISNVQSQSIGTFTSVKPAAQDELFHIPSSHTFQVLIRAGDGLTAGGSMPLNSDFTGYVPIGGSSENGYLSVNSETVPGGVTILDINYNGSTNLWEVTASEKVDFSELGNAFVPGTVANCSGTVTPWNTIVTCEENEISGDLNGDGYNDWGWNIEIDPVTKVVIDQDGDSNPDKLWAMGRMKHENVVITPDCTIAYFGEDNSGTGFVYKYVMNTKADLENGALYVLQQAGTTGTWILVPNTSQSERNGVVSASLSAGGTLFNRVEDVEIGPDGRVYFASTGNGIVYRFYDDGSTVSGFEKFVDNVAFDIDYGAGVETVSFSGCDNLAFDGEGNLWVLQDGGGRHIWMVKPSHTSAAPAIEIFANTPLDSEPTGITFSPDYRFMFISIQHPDNGNSDTQQDVTGTNYACNRDMTIVIARNEHLGGTVGVEAGLLAPGELRIIHVFPNPAKDILKVEINADKPGTGRLEVIDLMGKRCFDKEVRLAAGTSEIKIDLRQISAGNYFVKLTGRQQQVTSKFTILK